MTRQQLIIQTSLAQARNLREQYGRRLRSHGLFSDYARSIYARVAALKEETK